MIEQVHPQSGHFAQSFIAGNGPAKKKSLIEFSRGNINEKCAHLQKELDSAVREGLSFDPLNCTSVLQKNLQLAARSAS